MKRTESPKKQPVPFGINGLREDLLPTTPSGDNAASYLYGFPPITMALKAAGGLPPKGQDMNQILYELSSLLRWSSTGAINSYDADFSSLIGGYPDGAMVIGNDSSTIYLSTMDSNVNDPNSSATGWLNLAKITAIAALSGGADKLPYFNGINTASQTSLTQVGRDIIGKSAVSDILTYLGLGSAAKKDVGTGAGQIPDMSSWNQINNINGYEKHPTGIITQWGTVTTSSSAIVNINFPVPFPNACFSMVAIEGNNLTSAAIYTLGNITSTGFGVRGWNVSGAAINGLMRWFAVGV